MKSFKNSDRKLTNEEAKIIWKAERIMRKIVYYQERFRAFEEALLKIVINYSDLTPEFKKIKKKIKFEGRLTKKVKLIPLGGNKIHAGYIRLRGINYRFLENNNNVMLYLSLGLNIQRHLKVKCGSRVLLQYDKENPFKIRMTKTKKKELNSYKIMQHKHAKCVHFFFTWKFKKTKNIVFKEAKPAKTRISKDSILIYLK